MKPISAPAATAFSLPVMTMQPMASSASKRSMAAPMPSLFRAFIASGRLMRIRPTLPMTSVRTTWDMGFSKKMAAPEGTRGRPKCSVLKKSAVVEADRQFRRGGAGLAAQDVALLHLVCFQREVLVHDHLAAQHLGTAGTADAGLARERQVEAGLDGGIEHMFVGADLQFMLLAVEHDGQCNVLAGGFTAGGRI